MLMDYGKMEAFESLRHLQTSSFLQIQFVNWSTVEFIVHGNGISPDLRVLWPFISRAPMEITIPSRHQGA